MALQLCIGEGVYYVDWSTTEQTEPEKLKKVPETSRTSRVRAQGSTC